ncbi:hypothetical protein D3C80_1891040 [compost metagenome]
MGPQVIKEHCGFFESVGPLNDHDTAGALVDLKLRPGQHSQQKFEIQRSTGQHAEGFYGHLGQRRQFRYRGQQGFTADGRDYTFTGMPCLHANRAAERRDGQFGQVHVIPRLFVM